MNLASVNSSPVTQVSINWSDLFWGLLGSGLERMVDYLHSLRPTVNGEIFLTMIRLDKVTMLKLKLELSKDVM